jgi:hypothetical protein
MIDGRDIAMKRLMTALVIVGSSLGFVALIAQSTRPAVIAEFRGASLKWIHIAQPEFEREKLDLDNYTVSVVEENHSVTVVLTALDAVKGAFGSSGSHPGFEVEISKKDLKVVRSNFIR